MSSPKSMLAHFILLKVCNVPTQGMQLILCRRRGAGHKSRAQHFPADLSHDCTLKMAFPCRYVDLVNVFGLPTNRKCYIYHSTVDFLYFKYARKLNHFEIWKDHLPAFAQAFLDFGSPYDNLGSIFDGHNVVFLWCCLPVGLGILILV